MTDNIKTRLLWQHDGEKSWIERAREAADRIEELEAALARQRERDALSDQKFK